MPFLLKDVSKVRGKYETYSLYVPHFSSMPGDRIAITGRSGCGKSSFLDLLALISKPDSSKEFSLFGMKGNSFDIGRAWEKGQQSALADVRLQHMGHVSQNGCLFPFLTVWQNIAFVSKTLGINSDE